MATPDTKRFERAFFSACDECLKVFTENGFSVEFTPSNGGLLSTAVYSALGVEVIFSIDLREIEVLCDLAEGRAGTPSSVAMDPFGYFVEYKGYRGGGPRSKCVVDKQNDPEEWVKCRIDGERDFILQEMPEILSNDFVLRF